MSIVKDCVLPGDDLRGYIQTGDKKNKTILGPGIYRHVGRDELRSLKAGQLWERNKMSCILSHQRFYSPVAMDNVIGVVVSGSFDECRLDIGSHEYVTLSLYQFIGASKKNKPNIKIGDIVYASVLKTGIDRETELTCIRNRLTKWGLGVLPTSGYMVKVPINICRRLLDPKNQVIKVLGEKYAFETAIGMNGRIWIRGLDQGVTIKLANIIKQLEYIPVQEYEKFLQLHT